MKKFLLILISFLSCFVISQPVFAMSYGLPQSSEGGLMTYPLNNLNIDWWNASAIEYFRAADEVNWCWDHMDPILKEYIEKSGYKITITNKDILPYWNKLVPYQYMTPGEYDIFGFHESSNKVIYVTTRKSDIGDLGIGTGNTLAHECAHIGITYIPGFKEKYLSNFIRPNLSSELYRTQKEVNEESICDNYAMLVMYDYYH